MLCKQGKASADSAADYLSNLFKDEISIYKGRVGDPFPEGIEWLEYDYLISFLSPWIIPEHLLKKAKCAAINFHPAPPEYPGTGCFNFALYDDADTYGATCHHMAPEVDSGEIVAVRRFSVYQEDSVLTLSEKTYAHMQTLFYDIMDIILSGKELPSAVGENWRGKARTRKELDALCEIHVDMEKEEVERRVRATVFPNMPGPQIRFCGEVFTLAGK